MKYFQILLITTFLCSNSVAGERLDKRRISRAEIKIYKKGIPHNVNGMCSSTELKLNYCPVVYPFGANVMLGKSVAFKVVEGKLVEPRQTNTYGCGGDIGVGIDFPISAVVTNEIRSFQQNEYLEYTQKQHVNYSVKIFAAGGGHEINKKYGNKPFPGKIEESAVNMIGLNRVGIGADVKVMVPSK